MKKHNKIMTLVCAFCCLTTTAKEPDLALLNQYITQAKALTNLPTGTAVAIVKNDEIIYLNHFGYSNVSTQTKVTHDTRFYIASITKPMYALSTLIDIQQGKLSDNSTMSQLFPTLSFSSDKVANTTTKQLLTHTSNFQNYPLTQSAAYTGIHTLKSSLNMLEHTSIDDSLAAGDFDYSNIGYNILSVWDEAKNKTSWQEKIAKHIFTPLGMTTATSFRSKVPDNLFAKPYSAMTDQGRSALYLEKQNNTSHAGGGTFVSAQDLAKFVVLQLNQGKLNGKQIVPASLIAKQQQKQAIADTNFRSFKRDGYGWGLYTGRYKEQLMLHHFGGFSGYNSHMSFIPEKGIGLVVLNNEDILAPIITEDIADIAYKLLLGTNLTSEDIDVKTEKLVKKHKQLQAFISKNANKIASRTWQLTQPKSDYIGTYQHELLGEITIELNNENLVVTWGNLQAIAQPFSKQDSMRIELVPNSGTVILANIDNNNVVSIKIKGHTFTKM